MRAAEVTDSYTLLLLKKGSDSKCDKYPQNIPRQYFPRSEAKLIKHKCADLPTDAATKNSRSKLLVHLNLIRPHLSEIYMSEPHLSEPIRAKSSY